MSLEESRVEPKLPFVFRAVKTEAVLWSLDQHERARSDLSYGRLSAVAGIPKEIFL